jgi:hypothetical protein
MADDTSPGPAESVYLVYSIEADNQPAGEWRGKKKTELAFIPSPKGAYFARNAEKACRLAAMRFGRAGTYVAVETVPQTIEFNATRMDEPEQVELEGSAREALKRRFKVGH